MNTTEQGGLRCHDADACAFGQKPCPTPAACGCAPQAQQVEALHLKIERNLMERSLDEWVMQTGAVTRNSSWHSELASIVQMAFDKGAEVQAAQQSAQAAPQAVQPAVPGHGEVLVTVSGFTGSGKSAIAGEIEIMCRALGLQVEWPDGVAEKNMAGADWQTSLELYKPRIRIVECNLTNSKDGHDN